MTNTERDLMIEYILESMAYGQNYAFNNLYMSALLKINLRSLPDKPSGKENPTYHYFPSQPERPIKLLQDMMLGQGLIEPSLDAVANEGIVVTLTLKGQSMKDSGGWAKHLSNLNKSKSILRFDNLVKAVAFFEGIAIIIFTPIAVALQSKSNTLEKDNKELAKQVEFLSRQIRSTKDSLDNLKSRTRIPDSTILKK